MDINTELALFQIADNLLAIYMQAMEKREPPPSANDVAYLVNRAKHLIKESSAEEREELMRKRRELAALDIDDLIMQLRQYFDNPTKAFIAVDKALIRRAITALSYLK
jgi:hypothetical protein